MSMMFLVFAGMAQAADGTLVRLGVEADPSFMPELQQLAPEEVAPGQGWTEADAAAIEALRAELEAVRPLADEFDGELRIMSRLQAVIADVHVLRDQADRDLLYAALVFQGFAVTRYFQDQLATDAAAAPYRASFGGAVTVKAWLDAVALDPDADPAREDLPGDLEARAFDEARAKVRLSPKASVLARELPDGVRLFVDGRQAKSSKELVAPGFHRVTLVRDGVILARAEATLEPGGEFTIALPVMASDLSALSAPLQAAPDALSLDPDVAALLSTLPMPVYLAVEHRGEPLLYALQGGSVIRVEDERDAAAWLGFSLDVGGGWIYDGDYLLLNQPGAPADTLSVVNAGMPVLGARLWMNRGLFGASVGTDLLMPMGDFHSLPSGEGAIRARAHPYASAGLPWVQLSVGYLFPWQPGPGLRVRVPIGDRYELGGAAIVGLGRTLTLEDEVTTYEASNVRTGWVSVGGRFGLR